MAVELVVVEDVVVEVAVELVDDVEVELKGTSAIPASAQVIELEATLKRKFVGEETPPVEYSAYPPNVPPLEPEERVKPEPAVVVIVLGVPTTPRRNEPL